MTPPKGGGKALQTSPPDRSLSAEAHKQAMDYLRLAEKSTNPDISKAAIKMARDTEKRQGRREARLTPGSVAVLATGLIFLAVAGSWYSFVHYTERMAWQITAVLGSAVLLAVGVLALLSGHLSQANFIKLIESIVAWWKRESAPTDPNKHG